MNVRGCAVITASLAAAVALSACTAGGGDSTSLPTGAESSAATGLTHSSGSTAPKSTTTSGHKSAPTPVTLPVSPVNVVKKRKSVLLTGCAAASGGWQASGTATNPESTAAKYTITVFFTDQHATVENFAVTDVTVAPGQTAHWQASKKFTASPKSLCVLRGVG
jgi:hypothetical protein